MEIGEMPIRGLQAGNTDPMAQNKSVRRGDEAITRRMKTAAFGAFNPEGAASATPKLSRRRVSFTPGFNPTTKVVTPSQEGKEDVNAFGFTPIQEGEVDDKIFDNTNTKAENFCGLALKTRDQRNELERMDRRSPKSGQENKTPTQPLSSIPEGDESI